MAAHCGNCLEVLDVAGGRLPPWCPKCGADINKSTLATPNRPREPEAAPPVAISRDPIRPEPTAGRPEPPPLVPQHFDVSKPVAVFEASWRGYFETAGAGILMAGILFAIALGGFALALTRPNANTTLPALIMVGLGVGVLGFTSFTHNKRVSRVVIFADGIRWHSPDGSGRLAWADVDAVYRSEIVINGFPKSELKLVSKSGREVTFDRSLGRYRELMGYIQGRCADQMRAQKRQEAGSCGAQFGPVLVGPTGVSTDGWLVPWESIERYYLASGRLWIEYLGHGRKAILLHTIPNCLLLLYLMGEFAPPSVREASGVPV